MVLTAIKRMKSHNTKDIEDLESELLTHASELLSPILANLLNSIVVSGFPTSWCTNVIHPIHKNGDPMNPDNYRTIMIGHVLAKLYGTILQSAISSEAESRRLHALGQASFRSHYSTTDHIFTLRTLIEEAKHRKERVYCCFVDFRKAFGEWTRN